MKVRDVMQDHVLTLTEDDTLTTAASVMIRGGLRMVPVVDKKERLLGVIGDRDLLNVGTVMDKELAKTTDMYLPDTMRVKDVMRPETTTVEPDADLREAVDLLHDGKVDALPVVDGKRLVGVVSHLDMLRTLRGLLELQ